MEQMILFGECPSRNEANVPRTPTLFNKFITEKKNMLLRSRFTGKNFDTLAKQL